MNIKIVMLAALIVAVLIIKVIVKKKPRREKYRYYTIEVWKEILDQDRGGPHLLPEPELGPNLRQSIKTGKCQIGREAHSYLKGGYYYRWQPISPELANEIMPKIQQHKQVRVTFQNDAQHSVFAM